MAMGYRAKKLVIVRLRFAPFEQPSVMSWITISLNNPAPDMGLCLRWFNGFAGSSPEGCSLSKCHRPQNPLIVTMTRSEQAQCRFVPLLFKAQGYKNVSGLEGTLCHRSIRSPKV